jgi:hypothetical protein
MDTPNNNKPADQRALDEIMRQQNRALRDPYGLGLLDKLGPNPHGDKQNQGVNDE